MAMKSVNDILFAPIYANNGQEVGTVDDIIVDESSGNIEYLSIQPANEKQHMRVRVSWQEVKDDSHTKRLKIDMAASAAKRLLLK